MEDLKVAEQQYLNTKSLTYRVKDHNRWLKIVQDNHKDIRKKIGDVKISKKIEMKSKILPLSPTYGNLANILYYLKDYLKDYDLTKEDLLFPYIEKLKGISTIKHMKTYAEKVLKYKYSRSYADNNHNQQYGYYFSIYLDGLAAEYGRNKISDSEFEITLDTSANAFVQLGHYGIDGSCFSDGGCNWKHKYQISIRKNSFILIIKQSDSIVGRCWGFWHKRTDSWHTSNLYTYGVNKDIVKLAIKEFFNKPIQLSKKVTAPNIYKNGDDLSFLDKAPKDNKKKFSLGRIKQTLTF